jgi:ATP phosphoribosyltransferase
MLKVVIPKGSLEEQTLRLLEAADLAVRRGSNRDYHGSIDDDRIERVSLLRPQEIPTYVQDGLFDVGITGQDWIAETEADVEILATLSYAKSGTGHGTRVVLAVPNEHVANSAREIPPGTRISTEFMHLTERFFGDLGIDVRVVWSFGATEAKVPEIVDAIVDITETGSTLRAHGMKIIETLLESQPVLVANRAAAADPSKRAAMDDVTTLLLGALRAEGRVLIKLNVTETELAKVLEVVPSMKAPTVSPLSEGRLRDRDRGREATGQHADPAAQGGRRHGHPGAPDLQDRPVAPERTDVRRLTLITVATLIALAAPPADAHPGALDTFFSQDGIQTVFPNGGGGVRRRDRPSRPHRGGRFDAGRASRYRAGTVHRGRAAGHHVRSEREGRGRTWARTITRSTLRSRTTAASWWSVSAGPPHRNRFIVQRFRPNGTLDPGFATAGTALTGFGRRFQGATAVAIAPGGRIVVAGSTSNGITSRSALARYLADGRLDRSFGEDGRLTVDVSPSAEQFTTW